MIRLTIPRIEDEEIAAVGEVLRSGYLIQGKRVAEFEGLVAAEAGVAHGVAVANGTAALHLALLALDVRPGDLVCVPAYSWVATANVVPLIGAEPVFIDITADTFTLCPKHLEICLERLAANPETRGRLRAIIPVHAFGQMADMTALMALAERFGLAVIEDAACALGARRDGWRAGGGGRLGCFSFHPRKAITTGEGGMVVTGDAALAKRLRALRNHGIDPESGSTSHFVMPGFNYRLTEFQGALGVVQMGRMAHLVARRRELASLYIPLIERAGALPPVVPPGSDPVFQSYVVRLPAWPPGSHPRPDPGHDGSTRNTRLWAPAGEETSFARAVARRDRVIGALRTAGVEATMGTIHIPLTEYYAARYGFKPGDFPGTDEVCAHAVSLPLYDTLTPPELETVGRALATALTAER
jgi:perosamine synthetase